MTGKTFGKYEIIELIGKGGMAEVYKAKDKELGRYVALKILPPHFASDEEFVNRFVREAKSSAKLNHSNIVTIYDAGKHEDTYYIAMEYLEGETLKEIISRQGALPIDKSINIATQVADGLNYAHSQKIIHRDIKPGNIVTCEDGRAVITDFGIAKALEGTRLTQTGTMIGTPEYMSPEQATGEIVDARSDIYSLGIVLYEMVTGDVPFKAETPTGVIYKHVHEPPSPPHSINVQIPQYLEATILKAMEKYKGSRFQSAGEFKQALLGQIQPTVTPPTQPSAPPTQVSIQPPYQMPTQKTNLIPILAGIGGAVIVAIVILAIVFGLKQEVSLKRPEGQTITESRKQPLEKEEKVKEVTEVKKAEVSGRPIDTIYGYASAVNSRNAREAYDYYDSYRQTHLSWQKFLQVYRGTKQIDITHCEAQTVDSDYAEFYCKVKACSPSGSVSNWAGIISLTVEDNRWKIHKWGLKRY